MYSSPQMTCIYPPPHTGIRKAIKTGLYVAADFDKNEYFYYDDPNNGDMHEVMLGKFIAFKGPRSKRVELVNGSFTLLPSDYVEVFRAILLYLLLCIQSHYTMELVYTSQLLRICTSPQVFRAKNVTDIVRLNTCHACILLLS